MTERIHRTLLCELTAPWQNVGSYTTKLNWTRIESNEYLDLCWALKLKIEPEWCQKSHNTSVGCTRVIFVIFLIPLREVMGRESELYPRMVMIGTTPRGSSLSGLCKYGMRLDKPLPCPIFHRSRTTTEYDFPESVENARNYRNIQALQLVWVVFIANFLAVSLFTEIGTAHLKYPHLISQAENLVITWRAGIKISAKFGVSPRTWINNAAYHGPRNSHVSLNESSCGLTPGVRLINL